MKRFLLLAAAMVLYLCAMPSAASYADNHKSTDVRLIVTLQSQAPSEAVNSLASHIELHPNMSTEYQDNDFIIITYTGSHNCLNIYKKLLSEERCVFAVEEDTEDITLDGFSNDYFIDYQWSLNNTGSYSHVESSSSDLIHTTPDIDIDVPEGWNIYAGDNTPKRPVIVAIIDTGVDYKHPELANRMWINSGETSANLTDDDHNGYTDDIYGWDFYNQDSTVCHYEYNAIYKTQLSSSTDCDDHGTHIAGIISATANNGMGIAGIAAPADVQIMTLKIHGGTNRKGNISDAIKAIQYASMMGADVCNISWGSYTESTSLRTAVERSNMLFVCAAGNDGTNNDVRPLYPASYDLDNIISVTYVDANGKLTFDSNYGKESVDLAVPSTDIFSTIVGTYASMSGSSMAAPHVSAIAAMIYTYGEGLSAKEVKNLICSTVKPLDDFDKLLAYPGIPSLANALSAIDSLQYDYTAPTFTMTKGYESDNLVLNFTTSDDLSGPSAVRYFIGSRKASDFKNSTAGIAIVNNTLKISKSGLYTFYLNDRAGNYTYRPILITDDLIAPSIKNTGIDISYDQTEITITADVSDIGSGVKTVKYLPGRKSIEDFANSGFKLELINDKEVSFTIAEEGTYTLYAIDHRGNKSVVHVMAYIRRATSLKFRRSEKTLAIGEKYSLRPTMTPEYTTDKITYTSTNNDIASISASGRISAIAPGKAIITGTTSSGQVATCIITVE